MSLDMPYLPENMYSDALLVTEWRRTFVLTIKTSMYGTCIRPFSFAYTREHEAYDAGQRLLFTSYLTETEYTMELLKAERES